MTSPTLFGPTIDSFQGEYRFLSNFWLCTIVYNGGYIYGSTEAAYQAAKSLNPADHVRFTRMSPGVSKREGKRLIIRDDWDIVKTRIMVELVRQKFTSHNDLKMLLLNTGDALLVEGNTWGDTFWGVCNGKGENKLGKILMMVRQEIYEEKYLPSLII